MMGSRKRAIDKAAKLHALFEDTKGTPEGEAALKALQQLMNKHGLRLDDFDSSAVDDHWLTYKTQYERDLIRQIVYKVTNDENSNKGYLAGKRRYYFSATAQEAAQIEQQFSYYRNLWSEEVKSLLDAFIQKHSLFGEPDEDHEGKPMSYAEVEAMMARMSALKRGKFHIQIEAG